MPSSTEQKKYFENLLKNGTLGHAYLFTGPNEKIKKDFAQWLCKETTGWEFENNPNLKIISPDAEKATPVIDIESIREMIRGFISLKPYLGDYKMVLIENAETITNQAANALLKTLEEPPAHSIIILLASKPKALPATIISRCEKVFFYSTDNGNTADNLRAFDELKNILEQPVAAKIKYAKKVNEDGNYGELVGSWLSASSAELEKEPSLAPVVRGLLNLSQVVSQPAFNHRLALERFLLSC